MSTTAQPTTPALDGFVAVWASSATIAPGLSCIELDALMGLFGAAGEPEAAAVWIEAHADHGGCDGHSLPEAPTAPATAGDLFDRDGNYCPPPGTEYPFAVSDIARAAVALLPDGWQAESRNSWGTCGSIFNSDRKFTLLVDEDNDLCLDYRRLPDERLPDVLPEGVVKYLDGFFFELAAAADGLHSLAVKVAAAVRAATGS
ncbi:hypothetical protein ACWC1D_25720 [Streptomyces sp. NPDC001478]